MTTYIPARTSDPVNPDTWQTGQAEFESLTAKIIARDWVVEHDANMPFYGKFWLTTPDGTFEAQGFGRLDSLTLCWEQALSADKASKT